jgi:FtsP/CotA-like multicopper oxidase with cupredoxin domain
LGTVSNPEAIVANTNRAPAGTLRNGVLSVRMEAREGLWRPQADEGEGVVVQAFGVQGGPLQIPGPLLRVRAGTRIDITLHNTLGEALVVYGLNTRPGAIEDTLHIAAGAARAISFAAGEPGTYYYWGTTTGASLDLRDGRDSQLHGALIVDPATGPVPDDRIFVLGLWLQPEDLKGPEPHGEREIMVINGKSWPHTERLEFTVGDSVRWRWINPTVSSHPMHLHGFYFQVDKQGDWGTNTEVPARARRLVATELMLPGRTMDIRWTPEREGNWVFHCHFAFHVSDQLYLAPSAAAGDHSAHDAGKPHAMAGLVLGMHVKPNPYVLAKHTTMSVRPLRLLVQQRTDTTFEGPRLGYALHTEGAEPEPDSLGAPGPLLVLRRGEPVAITVVNRLTEPTAVHWHGIELESFPDGIPGWSGTPARLMPAIAPQDSFTAEFVPPRAGTFIYHSHSNELGQMLGGLVGPLVVLDGAAEFDAERERIFLLSGIEGVPIGLVNGEVEPRPMELVAGRTYRFRFINIGDWRMYFTLLNEQGFPSARMIAKDGADLAEPVDGPLNLLTGPGETADFEFTPEAGTYRLEFKQQLSGFIIPLEIRAR